METNANNTTDTIPERSTSSLAAAPLVMGSIPGLPELWHYTQGSPEVCVAMIDGAVDTTHSCFRGANVVQMDDASAATEHGTHVASIIFGQPTSAIRGIAPHCRGLFIPVFKEAQGTIQACSQLDLARAIQQAADQGAHIINISAGEYSSSGQSETILSETIRRCAKDGIVIIAAAGNDGCPCVHVPASEPSVLAIGAMDAHNQPLSFSNWGEAYRKKGLLVPGAHILGALPNERMATKTGTSFAAPICTGLVALLVSLQLQQGAKPNARFIADTLLKQAFACDTSQDIACERMLAGRLNIVGALETVLAQPRAVLPAKVVSSSFEGTALPVSTTDSIPHFISTPTTNLNELMSTRTNETMPVASTSVEPTGEFFSAPSFPGDTPDTPQAGIYPSECGCQKNTPAATAAPATQLAYAIGELGYEFRTQSSRDSFRQLMDSGSPDDPMHMLAHLDENPEASESIIWTLNLDSTPIYAIMPVGGFAADIYSRLREFLQAQLQEGVQRISVPGMVYGKVKLMSGQELPVIVPKGYGMYSWSTPALLQAILGEEPADETAKTEHWAKQEGIHNFLDRVYYELRNLGTSSQDRAINYAATNAFQIEKVFHNALSEQLELDSIEVERSPISRPNSDCWDVKLLFFHPLKRMERARKIYRFTIDVSHVIPVTIGKLRSWNIF